MMWFAHYDCQSSTNPLIIELKVSGASCIKEWAAVIVKVGIGTKYKTCTCTKNFPIYQSEHMQVYAHLFLELNTHKTPLTSSTKTVIVPQLIVTLCSYLWASHMTYLNHYADLTLFSSHWEWKSSLDNWHAPQLSPLMHTVTDVCSHRNVKELRKLYSLC